MDISVLITTYNRAPLLTDLLEALSKQNVPANIEWEVIVVDNNSNDKTRDVVENVINRFPAPIRYVFEPRQGQTFARNNGITNSRGDVIVFTDDDVIPENHWLASVWAAMTNSGVDGVGGRILPKWEAPVPRWLADSPQLWGYLAMMNSEQRKQLTLPLREGAKIWGANMAFKRSLFSEIGSFDTAIGNVAKKLYRGDETELVTRALRAGKRLFYDPSMIVHHRVGPDRMKRSYFRKVAFDGGEGRAGREEVGNYATILGAPRWLYRIVGQELWRCLEYAAMRKKDTFERQLDFLDDLGQLWGFWKMYFRNGSDRGRREHPLAK